MESKVSVRIEFIDNDRCLAEDIAMSFPPGAEEAACFKVLRDIVLMGGFVQRGVDGIVLWPLVTIKKISVNGSAIATADMSDLARLAPLPKGGVTL